MSERVTLEGFMNMKPDGTVELLDGAHKVVARLYSRASNDLEEQNAKLREENERLKLFAKGDAIITDYWKDEDGTMHVLTTDGSSTYEYMRGGLAEENAKLRELVRDIYIDMWNCGEWLEPYEQRMHELGIEVR